MALQRRPYSKAEALRGLKSAVRARVFGLKKGGEENHATFDWRDYDSGGFRICGGHQIEHGRADVQPRHCADSVSELLELPSAGRGRAVRAAHLSGCGQARQADRADYRGAGHASMESYARVWRVSGCAPADRRADLDDSELGGRTARRKAIRRRSPHLPSFPTDGWRASRTRFSRWPRRIRSRRRVRINSAAS